MTGQGPWRLAGPWWRDPAALPPTSWAQGSRTRKAGGGARGGGQEAGSSGGWARGVGQVAGASGAGWASGGGQEAAARGGGQVAGGKWRGISGEGKWRGKVAGGIEVAGGKWRGTSGQTFLPCSSIWHGGRGPTRGPLASTGHGGPGRHTPTAPPHPLTPRRGEPPARVLCVRARAPLVCAQPARPARACHPPPVFLVCPRNSQEMNQSGYESIPAHPLDSKCERLARFNSIEPVSALREAVISATRLAPGIDSARHRHGGHVRR